MKTKTKLLLAFALAAIGAIAIAADSKKQPSADTYPLTTCIVGGDPLGKDGYVTYTHKEAGKPDRVVRFCCEGCIDDFKATPAKFLAKLDAAEAAAKAKSAPSKKS